MARPVKHNHPHEHPLEQHTHPPSHTCLAQDDIRALVKAELDGYEERIRVAMRDEWKKLYDPGVQEMEERVALQVEGIPGNTNVRGGLRVITRNY